MSFVVETGAGLSNANSYASVAAADAYNADRGYTDWASLNTAEKQVALIRATDYIEATYRSSWKGYKKSQGQALSWPRYGVFVEGFAVPDDSVPVAVVNSCIEMALKTLTYDQLIIDQQQRVVREKVDVIETEYAEFSDPAQRYPQVNRMLVPYLVSSTSDSGFSQVKVVRT
jgi:hypothetical protein